MKSGIREWGRGVFDACSSDVSNAAVAEVHRKIEDVCATVERRQSQAQRCGCRVILIDLLTV